VLYVRLIYAIVNRTVPDVPKPKAQPASR